VIDKVMVAGPFAPFAELQNKYLKEAGAESLPHPEYMFLDAWVRSMDVTLQLCSPELEHPRSDLPSNVKFAGCLPRKPISPDYTYPSWWSEITENAASGENRKKVVLVTQGTIATEWHELIFPSLEALDGRDDLIVVVVLGVKGVALPETVKIPANTRIQDYLLYDAILEYADVFVSNGGYGGVIHAVVNGVPQVLGGETQDKNETCMRVEYAGLGVSLRTQTPTKEQILEGVEKVLGDPKYKERALEVKRINEEMDCLAQVEKQILEFTH
jgi:UDP:flavonoid glycosyltransferase YjiC (YdhE family)